MINARHDQLRALVKLEQFYIHMCTAASTKSHASEKIKCPNFGILRIESDVFFDADSDYEIVLLSKCSL